MNFRSRKESYELKVAAYEHMRRTVGFTALSGVIGAISQTDIVQQAAQQENILGAAWVCMGLSVINMMRDNYRAMGLSAGMAGGLAALLPHQELVQQVVQEDNLIAATGASLAVAGVSGVMAMVRWGQGEVGFRENIQAIRADRQAYIEREGNVDI